MCDAVLHTAICTWSGFVYQGKIALLHALQVLIDEESQEAQNYQLQLDYLDDFAVLDSQGNARSLHQVKAYKSGYFSAYREAFKAQQEKVSSTGCTNLFFHVACEITDETSSSIANQYSPVKLYNYPQQGTACYYCSLSDVDSEIEARIRTFFVNNHSTESYRINYEYITKCRCYLDQIIQKQVIDIHAAVHAGASQGDAAAKKTISFSRLIDALNTDLNHDSLTEDYFFWILKLDLGRYFHDFCLENEVEDETEKGQRLIGCMCKLNTLDINGMKMFIRSIVPHRECRLSTLAEYKDDTVTHDQICDGFLTILGDIDSTGEFPFLWKATDKTYYAPTAIIHSQRQCEKVCRRIVENVLDQDVQSAFEAQKLITIDIEAENIFQVAHRVLDQYDESDDNYKKISHWKKVALVTLEQAKDAINE